MSDGYLSAIRESTAFRLLVLFTSFFVLLIVAAGVGALFDLLSGIDVRTKMLAASGVQCVVAFCLSAWITGKFSSSEPVSFLGLADSAPVKAYIGVLIVYFLALPAMNQLIAWNAGLHFPEWASGLENTLRGWEDANSAVTEKVLSAGSFGGMLCGVAIVGILTGFSEELFFRGGLQGIFSRSGVGVALSVWGAAAIFSAVHFQFFGFFPRLLMGAFFGYLLVWTCSLWPAVFAHALNNSIVVVSYWCYGDDSAGGIDGFGIAGEGELPWGAIASVVATTLFFWRFRGSFFQRRMDKLKELR